MRQVLARYSAEISPVVKPLADSEITKPSTPVPPLPLADDLRFERSVPIPRHIDLHRADVGDHRLRPRAIARVPAIAPSRIVLVVPEVVCDLAFQGRLQDPLGQLLQQPPSPVSWAPLARACRTNLSTRSSSAASRPLRPSSISTSAVSATVDSCSDTRCSSLIRSYTVGLTVPLLEPGVVSTPRWRPGPSVGDDMPAEVDVFCGAARKL